MPVDPGQEVWFSFLLSTFVFGFGYSVLHLLLTHSLSDNITATGPLRRRPSETVRRAGRRSFEIPPLTTPPPTLSFFRARGPSGTLSLFLFVHCLDLWSSRQRPRGKKFLDGYLFCGRARTNGRAG
jgi:hypothetical protein